MESKSEDFILNSELIEKQFSNPKHYQSNEKQINLEMDIDANTVAKFDVNTFSVESNDDEISKSSHVSTSKPKKLVKTDDNGKKKIEETIMKSKTDTMISESNYKELSSFWADWHKILEYTNKLQSEIIKENERMNNFLILHKTIHAMMLIPNFDENAFHDFKALYLNESKYFRSFNIEYKKYEDILESYEKIFKNFILTNSNFVEKNLSIETQMNYSVLSADTTKSILKCKQQLSALVQKYNEKILGIKQQSDNKKKEMNSKVSDTKSSGTNNNKK